MVPTHLYVFRVGENFVHRIHYDFFVIELSIVEALSSNVVLQTIRASFLDIGFLYFHWLHCARPPQYTNWFLFHGVLLSRVSWYSALIPISSIRLSSTWYYVTTSKSNNMDFPRSLVVIIYYTIANSDFSIVFVVPSLKWFWS